MEGLTEEEQEADYFKWCGVIDRHTELYFGLNSDCAVIPKYLLPRLAEKFEGVKEYIELSAKPKEDIQTDLKSKVLMSLAIKERNEATELLVNHILSQKDVYTTRNDDKEEVYIYSNGIYVPQGKTYIREMVRIVLGEAYTNQIYNEVLSKIEADTYIEQKEFSL